MKKERSVKSWCCVLLSFSFPLIVWFSFFIMTEFPCTKYHFHPLQNYSPSLFSVTSFQYIFFNAFGKCELWDDLNFVSFIKQYIIRVYQPYAQKINAAIHA